MRRVSDALRTLVGENAFLQFGLHHRLLNLSQLARFLKPQLRARLDKEIEESAITMNLSRMQREYRDAQPLHLEELRITNLVIHSNLCVLVYPMTAEVHAAVNRVYNRVQKAKGYITITEGISEVAIITEQQYHTFADELLHIAPVHRYLNIASLGVKFDSRYLRTVGLYYTIFQQLYFQRINIIEIASAGTELIIYIEDKDVRLAFDTLYNKFGGARTNP